MLSYPPFLAQHADQEHCNKYLAVHQQTWKITKITFELVCSNSILVSAGVHTGTISGGLKGQSPLVKIIVHVGGSAPQSFVSILLFKVH